MLLSRDLGHCCALLCTPCQQTDIFIKRIRPIPRSQNRAWRTAPRSTSSAHPEHLRRAHECTSLPHKCTSLPHECTSLPHECTSLPHECTSSPHECTSLLSSPHVGRPRAPLCAHRETPLPSRRPQPAPLARERPRALASPASPAASTARGLPLARRGSSPRAVSRAPAPPAPEGRGVSD